ncbi:MAG TPA: hypothetical protein VGR35_23785 [Tepidisphaeraceae bacterium]|nr:hypothetical protein [Tepidisphaeraceae bacterium]
MEQNTQPHQERTARARVLNWVKRRFDYEPGVRAARYQQLRTEVAGLLPATADKAAFDKLFNRTGGATPQWESLFEAEVQMITLLPLEALLIKHGNLSEEYASVAGSDLAAAYFARLAAPKDVTGPRNREEQLRFEAVDMLAQIQRLRIIRNGFAVMRKRITFIATLAAAVFCVLIAIFFLEITQDEQVKASETVQVAATGKRPLRVPFATTSIIIAGMLGGCVSALARLYLTPWTGELANGVDKLTHTFWGLVLNFALSILEGGIFAVLLYLAVMGNFFAGDLFPKFRDPPYEGEFKELRFFHMFFERGPRTHVDFAKAVVWAFAAGFVERLVPDFLNTLKPQLRLRTTG